VCIRTLCVRACVRVRACERVRACVRAPACVRSRLLACFRTCSRACVRTSRCAPCSSTAAPPPLCRTPPRPASAGAPPLRARRRGAARGRPLRDGPGEPAASVRCATAAGGAESGGAGARRTRVVCCWAWDSPNLLLSLFLARVGKDCIEAWVSTDFRKLFTRMHC
jgi:hypothetical protein